jgi:glycosyltransferase involved in cell wall biosynthesis
MSRVLLAFEPPDGGVAENVLQLARGLGAHGWEVELAGPLEARIYPDASAAGVRIHRLPFVRGYGSPRDDLAALRGLRALLRNGSYELVHCHSAKAGVLGRLAARSLRVPAVYSPHCFPFVGEFGRPRRVFATTVERLLAPLSAAIVCVCEDERQRGLDARVGDRSRLRVVLNGCEACDPTIAPDQTLLELQARGPLAAVVSVLRAQKSVDVFIEAAGRVLARVPEAQLAVVGEGPLLEDLRTLAGARGLLEGGRLVFLPFQAPAARHLRAIDVFVLPSSWEGLPIGVLEALACGVPQVATDVGGTGEAVGGETVGRKAVGAAAIGREAADTATGLLVPPHDPEALAAALIELLEDPDRRARMARASIARHAEHFTLERMVAETAAVYVDAVAGAGS